MIITCQIGFGPKVTGEFVVLGKIGEVLSTQIIDRKLLGKILVLKGFATRTILEKAGLVGIVGAVVPSMHYRDYKYFQDLNDFPILVMQEFGRTAATGELASKLDKLGGKKGELDGEQKSLKV